MEGMTSKTECWGHTGATGVEEPRVSSQMQRSG